MSHHVLMDATKSSGFLGDLPKLENFSAASASTQKDQAKSCRSTNGICITIQTNKFIFLSMTSLFFIVLEESIHFTINNALCQKTSFQRCIWADRTRGGLFRHKLDGYYIKPHLLFTMACFRLSRDIWLDSQPHCAIF